MTDPGTPPPADPRVGTLIGSMYEIVDVLGEGGIGTVYVAQFGPSRERVAVKLLRREYSAHPELAARFEREASATAGLVHENIVRAFDFGRASDGALYMVMELAEGESLRAALYRLGTLPVEATLAIARQVGSALERAHAAGVVHRDLKPDNVIVADAGGAMPRVKVLDFGMARVVAGDLASASPLTTAGAVLGSPSYMPPEQACGRPVDARADQYSLGVMLYEMLAGRRPFEAEEAVDILYMQVHDAPTPLAELAPQVPPAVAAAVARMMAKRADDRFPDVRAALDALAAKADAAPAAALPAAPSARAASRAGVDGRKVLGAALAVALALAGAVVWAALH